MTMPSAEVITNLYVYGQTTVPSDLISGKLIRPDERTEGPTYSVDLNDYMENGPGRFAKASDSSFIGELFNLAVHIKI